MPSQRGYEKMKWHHLIVLLGSCSLALSCSPSPRHPFAFVVHSSADLVFVQNITNGAATLDVWRLSTTGGSHEKLHSVYLTDEDSGFVPSVGYKSSVCISHSGKTWLVNADGKVSVISEKRYDGFLSGASSDGVCVAVSDGKACLFSLDTGQEIEDLGECVWSGAYMQKDVILLWEESRLEVRHRGVQQLTETLVLDSEICAVDMMSSMLAVVCSHHIYTYSVDEDGILRDERKFQLFPYFSGFSIRIVTESLVVGCYGTANPFVINLVDTDGCSIEMDLLPPSPGSALLIAFDDSFLCAVNSGEGDGY
mgnify:CR=1 FL=1